MTNLTYKSIKEMMGDMEVAFGTSEEYGAEIFQHKPFYDEDGTQVEDAYRVSFVTKRDEDCEWWCHHIYHEDGTFEELFEFSGCLPRKETR